MKLQVFGVKNEITRSNREWEVYYWGSEGKKRYAHDIIIPKELDKSELIQYLDDLHHERANPGNTQIFEIN